MFTSDEYLDHVMTVFEQTLKELKIDYPIALKEDEIGRFVAGAQYMAMIFVTNAFPITLENHHTNRLKWAEGAVEGGRYFCSREDGLQLEGGFVTAKEAVQWAVSVLEH